MTLCSRPPIHKGAHLQYTSSYYERCGVFPNTMELSLYQEDGFKAAAVKRMKSNMTLDFNTGVSAAKKQKMGTILASPDLNMLKLASPELERMIIAQNGMVTTTPTPTQFVCPKNVTEEQEAYARGFVDALNELHSREGPGVMPPPQHVSTVGDVSSAATTSSIYSSAASTLAMSTAQPYTITTSMPVDSNMMTGQVTELLPATITTQQPTTVAADALANIPTTSAPSGYQLPVNNRVMHLKEEPQTVPCMGNTPPISPIDMESQERIKLERKRERNRVAARKCRTRKLERISRLEDRVTDLKNQNSDLTATASELRDQVCKLKEQIMKHVNSGCQVMLSQNLL